jgi:hypothetical protein
VCPAASFELLAGLAEDQHDCRSRQRTPFAYGHPRARNGPWGRKDSNLRPTDYESRRKLSIEPNLVRLSESSPRSSAEFGGCRDQIGGPWIDRRQHGAKTVELLRLESLPCQIGLVALDHLESVAEVVFGESHRRVGVAAAKGLEDPLMVGVRMRDL